MENSKLVNLLSTFSKKEQQAFRDFVASPYFNKNKQVEMLLEFVLKHAPDFRGSKFSIKQASKRINISNNHSKFSQLQTKLVKLAEEFIAQQAFKEDHFQIDFYVLDYFVDHQLESMYTGHVKKVEKALETEKRKDIQSFWKYKTEDLHSQFLVSRKDDGTGDLNRLESARSLDLFYTLSKLKQQCVLLNRKRIASFDLGDMDFIGFDQFLANSDLQKNPFVRVWHTALRLLKGGLQDDYSDLKKMIKGKSDEFHPEDIRILYTFLENASSTVFSRSEYFKELFELYDQQLSEEIILNYDYILPATFRNIVTVGLVLDKLDWVNRFINEYKDSLPEDHQDSRDTLNYSLAQLTFKKQDFEKCLDHLNEISARNIYMKLNERRMRMKIYYELRYSQAFEDLVNSFRKFLSGKKKIIPVKHIQGHRDFVNCCLSLFKIIKKDHEKIEKLRTQINDISFLPEKGWLLEKLEALS